ncbi:acyl--CoA ligase [bacterium]|nr:acyl--CoA ligase [bacterium]
MKKTLLTALAAALFLTACFDYRESWVYGRDGSATVHIICALSKEFLAREPELTLEKERFLLEPFWKTNEACFSKVEILRCAQIVSNAHLALDIRLRGNLEDLAALPFFRQRTITFKHEKTGLTVCHRMDLGSFSATLPCDGTVVLSQTFPGDIRKANSAFSGRRIKEVKTLSELSDGKALVLFAQCGYPERWPWKETLYVALCFFLFFLFAWHSRNVRRRRPRDPAPVPGDIHSLPDLLNRSASFFSTLPAVRDVGRRGASELSFHTLHANANRLSHFLISRNLRPRDRVALLTANGRWRHVAVMGVLGAGGVVLPLDPGQSPEKLAELIKKHNVSFLILSESYQTLGSELLLLSLPPSCVLWLSGDLEKNILPECLLTQPTSPPLKGLTREDPALLLKKGSSEILLTHGEILSQVFASAQAMALNAQDVLMTTYGPDSIESLSFSVFLPLATASCVANAEGQDPNECFAVLRKAFVTVLLTDERTALGLTSRFRKLLSREKDYAFRRKAASFLKTFFLPHVFLLRALKERLGFRLRRAYILSEIYDRQYYYYAPMYGAEIMTGFSLEEAAGIVLLSTPLRRAYGASGAPLAGVQAKVVSEDGKTLEKGRRGLLALRGAEVIKRYWKQDSSNRSRFENGWLITDVSARENKDGTITLGGKQNE